MSKPIKVVVIVVVVVVRLKKHFETKKSRQNISDPKKSLVRKIF